MKFVIERAILLKTLNHVQSIVEKRNTIPVLSNVRIEALGDGISFKATRSFFLNTLNLYYLNKCGGNIREKKD